MIPLAKEIEVLDLLAAGRLSHRAIAKRTGVSRGSVNMLAFAEGPRQRKAENVGCIGNARDCVNGASPAVRCVVCCHQVHLPGGEQPCLACRTKADLAAGKDCRSGDCRQHGPCQVDLHGPDLERYQKLNQIAAKAGVKHEGSGSRKRESHATILVPDGSTIWRRACPRCGYPYYALRIPGEAWMVFAWAIGHKRQPLAIRRHCRNRDCRYEFPQVTPEEFTDRIGIEG